MITFILHRNLVSTYDYFHWQKKKTKLKTSSNIYCFSTWGERMKAKIIAKTEQRSINSLLSIHRQQLDYVRMCFFQSRGVLNTRGNEICCNCNTEIDLTRWTYFFLWGTNEISDNLWSVETFQTIFKLNRF